LPHCASIAEPASAIGVEKLRPSFSSDQFRCLGIFLTDSVVLFFPPMKNLVLHEFVELSRDT